MSQELVPEIHDCLKLTTLQHNFSDFDERFLGFSPKTRSWDGILQHHCDERFPAFPTDRDTFLLHMADGTAANFSRHRVSYKGESSFVVYKLWNPEAFQNDLRLSREDQIKDFLTFLATNPSFEEFADKYENILESRAEDARRGKNVTSLLAHLVLTGKFYRFFRKSASLGIHEKEIVADLGKIQQLTKQKAKEWQIYLTLCRVNFTQRPFRARDLNIFELLELTMQQIRDKFLDNILYQTSDQFLIYYDDAAVFDEIKRIALEHGFWLSAVWGRRALEEIKKADPYALPQHKSENSFSTSLPDKITPPVCEICQMASGNLTWPDEYLAKFGLDEDIQTEGVENLCETCFSIRSKPSKLRKIKFWGDENADVLYLRVALSYDDLTRTLQHLYMKYLRGLNPDARPEEAEIRFSLVWEFQRDYDHFLNMLKTAILDSFGAPNVEMILQDMFCIRITNARDSFVVLELLRKLMREFFPEFLNLTDNCVKVSISICKAKSPFFQIWREIETQSADLQIKLLAKGVIRTTFKYLDEILLATRENYRKTALFHLAEIAKLSEKVAEIKFNDRTEASDFYSYEALKRHLLPIGMDFKSILTFIRLLEG